MLTACGVSSFPFLASSQSEKSLTNAVCPSAALLFFAAFILKPHKSDMFSAFVYIALHSFCHRLSAAGHRDPPWFMGCVNASNRLHPAEAVRDLDPVTCSVRCLDEG